MDAQETRMSSLSILVTGAAGHIGSVTTAHLRAQGHSVRAVDLHPGKGPAVEIADLLLRESAYRVTESVDAVVHLANWPNVHMSAPSQVFIENATMTQHLFQAIIERGIKKLVYASSIQVMSGHRQVDDGAPSGLPYLPLDGDIPANPSNAYGVSKAAGEIQTKWLAQSHGVAAVALRLPAVLRSGFHDFRKRQGPRLMKGNLDEAFTVMHVRDAARLIEGILNHHQAGYRCVQGGSHEHASDRPVADIVAEYYADVPLRHPDQPLMALCDIGVLQRDFGFVPQESLWSTGESAAIPAQK